MAKQATNTELLDILSLAAAHLHDLGWTTGTLAIRGNHSVPTYSSRADAYCLIGALAAAAALLGEADYESRAWSVEFRQATAVCQTDFGMSLERWNDRMAASVDDVLEVLSRAAHRLSSK